MSTTGIELPPTIQSAAFRDADEAFNRQLERQRDNPLALPCERGSKSVVATCAACGRQTNDIMCSHSCGGSGVYADCPCPDALAILAERQAQEAKEAIDSTGNPCRYCGSMFWPALPHQVYCKPRCRKDAENLRKREATAARKLELRRQCKRCGRTFYYGPQDKKFCGTYCRNAYHIGKKSVRRRQARKRQYEVTCQHCGDAVVSEYAEKRYCGDKCRYAADYRRRKEAEAA